MLTGHVKRTFDNSDDDFNSINSLEEHLAIIIKDKNTETKVNPYHAYSYIKVLQQSNMTGHFSCQFFNDLPPHLKQRITQTLCVWYSS